MDPNQTSPQQPVSPAKPVVTTPLRAAPSKLSLSKIAPFLIVLVIVGLGIASGLVMSSRKKSTEIKSVGQEENVTEKVKESFNQTFKDEAEGTIETNDELDRYAQGTHKLVRPGGEDQTAFLTSSVLDLDQYVGKKVKVFGETFGSSQVGWLMDVGKVEVQ